MEKIKKYQTQIILSLIIILQLIVYVLVGLQKSYIHIDEGYSLGLIHYDTLDISYNEDFCNNWHDKEYYNDYLTIGQDEAKNFKPVYENQKNDVHPPLYYLLLRIAYSFHLGEFSKWPGLILNMFLLTLSTIMLYKVAKKIFNNEEYAIMVALGGAIVTSTLETCMLMRMYALNSLNILIITYLHLNIWNEEKFKIRDLVLIGISAVIGSLTHYYFLIFLFILYVIFMMRYIIRKQYDKAIKYTITMVIAAVCSLLIFPYSFKHIFMGYRGQGAFSNISKLDVMLNGLTGYLRLLLEHVFNKLAIYVIYAMIGLLVYRLVRDRKVTFTSKNSLVWVVAIPALSYFAIVAMVSPYIEIRYLAPVTLLLFLLGIYLVKTVLNTVIKDEKKVKFTVLGLIVAIILAPIITGQKPMYVYKDFQDIVYNVENDYKLPALYVFNTEQNRFMDDVYLFSKIDESYILDSKDMSKEKVEEIFKDKNIDKGILVFINCGQENDDLLEDIKEATKLDKVDYLKRLNACDVYYVHSSENK